MPKKPALRTEKQLELAREYVGGQHLPDGSRPTYASVAARHGIGQHHVVYAVRRYKSGRLGRPEERRRLRDQVATEALKEKADTREIIEDLVHTAAAELQGSNLEPREKVQILKQLASTQRELLGLFVQAQIKNPEADRVVRMMRALQAEITDEEIIELWHSTK